jgi:hypothetical protein
MFESLLIFSDSRKSIGGLVFCRQFHSWSFFDKIIFWGHFSSHTGSNDIGLEFVLCRGPRKTGVRQTHILSIIYIDTNLLDSSAFSFPQGYHEEEYGKEKAEGSKRIRHFFTRRIT